MHSYEKIRYPFDHIKENSKKPLVPHLAKTKLSLKILVKPQLSEIIKPQVLSFSQRSAGVADSVASSYKQVYCKDDSCKQAVLSKDAG